jgi:hypothetical protein
MRGVRLVFAAILMLCACKHGSKTPEEGFQRLEKAIAAGDAGEFWECLTQKTKWDVEQAYKEERLQRTIIQAKYPETEQAQALARLEAAAADDAKSYFARVAKERKVVEGYRKRLGSVSGPIAKKPDGEKALWLARQDGMPFHFAQNRDGSWGFSELETEWALERDRASHAVKTIRDNAATYEKAGN